MYNHYVYNYVYMILFFGVYNIITYVYCVYMYIVYQKVVYICIYMCIRYPLKKGIFFSIATDLFIISLGGRSSWIKSSKVPIVWKWLFRVRG